MKLLLAVILSLPALAQQPAAAPEEKKAEAAPAAEAKATESPVPSAEQWLTGSVEIGNRWLTDLKGSESAYRSVVNLGEGPRVTSLDFTLQDPKKRLFDRIDARGNSWGGDPYNTAHIDARKRGVYDFRFDYRNIAYFNNLPTYANPTLPQGVLFSQRTFDTWRRMSSFELDLMPGKWIVPYFAYQRNGGRGRGVTDFVAEGNEYAVPTSLSDKTDSFRGGLRFELKRFHVTLEQGVTKYSDDQQVSGALRNLGNRTTPISGETLFLSGVNQQYGVTADTKYSRILVTGNPVSWANLFGSFLFSQPETTVRYAETASGNFVLLSSLLLYSGQQESAAGQAKAPHSSANFGFELRPLKRLRVIESVMLDRMHNASFGTLAETLLFSPSGSRQLSPLALADRLVHNYNQQQVDVIYDLTSRITLRGGHRYVWGDATVRAGQLNDIAGFEQGELKRQVGLAGITVRPLQKASVNVDYEGGASERAYFRTSLYDYHRARIRARYQVLGSLALQGNFSVFSNENPSPDARYEFSSRESALSAYWTPGGGKRISVTAEYMRSTLTSDIDFRVPQQLSLFERSLYRDNAHTATSMVEVGLPGYLKMTPRLSFGGSLFISRGERPTRYYQPMGRLSLPLQKHVYWITEWRWFGFGEQFYSFEAFRAHTFMTGLRLVR